MAIEVSLDGAVLFCGREHDTSEELCAGFRSEKQRAMAVWIMLHLESKGAMTRKEIQDNLYASFQKADYFEPVIVYDREHRTQCDIEIEIEEGNRRQIDRALARLRALEHVTVSDEYYIDVNRI